MTASTKKTVKVRGNKKTNAVLANIIARVGEGLHGTIITAPPASAYRLHMSEDQEYDSVIVDFMLDDETLLPLHLGGWALFEANIEGAANRLCKRLIEVSVRKEKLLFLLATAKERIAAAVDKVGGEVRLHDVNFAPVSAEYGINMRDIGIEASFTELDLQLAPKQRTERGATAHEIVQHMRFIAPLQRRLAKQRERLLAADALFEISALAEAAIATTGQNLHDVLRRAASGETLIALGGKATKNNDTRIYVSHSGGWLHLYGYVLPAPGGAFFSEGVLRFDQPLEESHRRELVGRPASELFDHPVMRAAGWIAKVSDCELRMTDVVLKGVKSRLIKASDLEAAN